MKIRYKKSGLSLMEMAVVIAMVALLIGLGLPAIRALINSFETIGGAKSMISAALSNVRAIAAKEQHYAGIRFQKEKDSQYMIFIVKDLNLYFDDEKIYGFREVQGLKPIKLPDNIEAREITNGDTTFSIIFSSSGTLVINKVRMINDEKSRLSQNSFILYDKVRPDKLETVYINRYMGTIISP